MYDTTLRKEWNDNRERLIEARHRAGYEGCQARANLDFLPALLTVLEREHQRNTDPKVIVQAMVGVLSTIALHTVRAGSRASQQALLEMVLTSVHDAVRERLRSTGNSILLPGLGG